MICDSDLLLILDTGILGDVLRQQVVTNPISCMKQWLSETVDEASCMVNGKTVTVATSTDLFSDYSTGLTRQGLNHSRSELIRTYFRGSARRKQKLASSNGDFFFIPFVVANPSLAAKRKFKRKNQSDKKLFELLDFLLAANGFKNRHIIFCSRDHDVIQSYHESYSNQEKSRVSLAESLASAARCMTTSV